MVEYVLEGFHYFFLNFVIYNQPSTCQKTYYKLYHSLLEHRLSTYAYQSLSQCKQCTACVVCINVCYGDICCLWVPKVQIIKHMYELFVVVFQNVQKIYAFSQLILLSHCSSKCCCLWSLELERKIYKVSPGVSSRALRVHPWSQQYIFFAWMHLFTQRC